MANDLDQRLTILETSFSYAEKARDLQAKEYERRLHDLNGEAERLRNIQATYVPREVYETNNASLATAVVELKEAKAKSEGKQTIIAVIIPVLISLGFLILNYFLR